PPAAPTGTCRNLRGRVGRGRVPREELQRGGVEAVAMTGRRWPVGEHVPEVTVAAPATDLDALHAVRAVAQEREVVGVERLVERRPAGARAGLGRDQDGGQSWQP